MARTGSHRWSRRLGVCLAGLPWAVAGCTSTPKPTPTSAPLAALIAPAPTILRAAAPEVAPVNETKMLPVSLDTVLRLAGDQNAQINLARERMHQASAERDLAENAWLPNVYVGTSYYRHEGGIQDFQGNLVHSSFGSLFGGAELSGTFDLQAATFQRISAESRLWQQKTDVAKVTNEQLLDAANTYIDLLTARTGEVVNKELTDLQDALEKEARKMAQPDVEPGMKVQLVAIEASSAGLKMARARLRQQGNAAAAKLAYLLGLDADALLVPVDKHLMAIELIDTTPGKQELISRATANGPGIHEMEGLINTIYTGMAEASSFKSKLPVVEARMLEGAFGAGPGSSMSWDNRWDLGLQARWNLTDLCNANDKRRIASSRMHQAHLGMQDLKGRLTAGVQEAYDAVQAGREQIDESEKAIAKAREAYKLSEDRRKANIPGSSAGEVLAALRVLELAQTGKLQAVNAYDKAQLRLMLLVGGGSAACP